ncbi:hypothetical protein D3C86_1705400 [compost metagenome]
MIGQDWRTRIELNRHLQAEQTVSLALFWMTLAVAAGRRGIGEFVEMRVRRIRLERRRDRRDLRLDRAGDCTREQGPPAPMACT